MVKGDKKIKRLGHKQLGNKTRVEQHDKLDKGDLVKINGERGVFEVMWVDVFDNQRPAEISVIGGSEGRKQWRTFVEDVVTKRPRKQQAAKREA
jgi:hypothetical protein